ncbi:MAG: PorV/PorQ family protein [Elusimicrobia bacterium]|nr:PorV/PorQ family protein [Elusimicrobiota bacterium]
MATGVRTRAALLVAIASFSILPQARASSILDIPTGARPAALGAYTAVSGDLHSLYWNPGGLSFITRPEIGFTHTELYGEARLETLGYAHPTGFGTFGLSVNYLGQGDIERRDRSGVRSGDYSASDRLFIAGYGVRAGRFGLGFNAKFIQQQIAETTASGFAADLGASYKHDSRVRLGVALLNVGPEMRWQSGDSQLPLTLNAGAAVSVIPRFMLSADVRHRFFDKKFGLGLGGEAEVYHGFLLRASYLAANGSMAAGSSVPALARFNAGFGLRLREYAVDYSFAPAGNIGNTQRLSLGYRF